MALSRGKRVVELALKRKYPELKTRIMEIINVIVMKATTVVMLTTMMKMMMMMQSLIDGKIII